ncbi:mitochondrial import inner membrane translocase subunit TIM14 [Coemansia aciculifera]|uniref:Mitochondrial import inner membrane translocase subunit TIM14 n=2 Tax=Coemansia TaxID=4863 RepID=A0A9W8IT25_9FUNG|nr:mitochondrial import inner membrane translocase subunit TIM14 [Coemansia sp. S146]KAJ2865196.1 mitochondrial import inner membrane translocase subunit TIM14 [Coemansia aciculifera]KAJ2874940.1 mitochondrial import inner membrane translocase subunit TIM14 [Coemansia aciculifera]KAJ2885062.1 mitochondrial import inner membrane translocase subunit TIM14 [Coemansia aciculifera]
MSTPMLIGFGVAGAAACGIALKVLSRGAGRAAAGPALKGVTSVPKHFLKGGFDPKMSKREAALILGLKESSLTMEKVKKAHRTIMLRNHPDRGGSPYMATKINEAKEFLETKARIR